MRGVLYTQEWQEVHTKLWSENRNGRNCTIEVGVAEKITLKRMLNIIYTGCPRRNVPDFGRVFLMLKYTDITQNTYIQI